MGRELGVPMRLCNLTLEDFTEAMNRGWDDRDSRMPMKMQLERAGVTSPATRPRCRPVLDAD